MAPAPDDISAPGAVSYNSDTMVVGDGTWEFTKNTFLLPNLQGTNFDTMRFNGMGNRFSTVHQYHTLITAHGILMTMVFLFLVPISVMIARFYSREPGYAIRYHAQLHIFASVLLLAGFILPFFAVGSSRNLTNPHHGIGIAIYVLFMVQIFTGAIVRRIRKLRSLRVTVHQWFGRATALLGIVQVPLGLTLYGSPKVLFILYSLWMGFLLVVYFILSYQSDRREVYMTGGRSEYGARSEIGRSTIGPSEMGRSEARTRLTESEYFSEHQEEHHSKLKWLGPLAAAAGLFAMMRSRKKDRGDGASRRSMSPSMVSRSRAPTTAFSSRPPTSYYDEKMSDAPQRNGGGGLMKVLGALGIAKLLGKRRDNRDDEYSAVSTNTPGRRRSGRATTVSEFASEYTDDLSTIPPSRHPTATAPSVSAVESRAPRTPARTRGNRSVYDDSEYSSYVSPSRRAPQNDDDGEKGAGGGFGKGLLSGLGLGWLTRKMSGRSGKKEEQAFLENDDGRSATEYSSKYTGVTSPSRRSSRRPARRSTGLSHNPTISELTESTEGPQRGPYVPPAAPPSAKPVPQGTTAPSALFPEDRSRPDLGNVAMPAIPDDPHGILHRSDLDSSVSRADRRGSSQRRAANDRAAAAAAVRGSSLAAEERGGLGTPRSQNVSVKVKVDETKGSLTLRQVPADELAGNRGRGGSEISSAMDTPTQGRRYRRDSSQRRAEEAAERVAEDDLSSLAPPNPAFAKNRRGKDSAYYSGGVGQPGQSSHLGVPPMPSMISSMGSHGTWSEMSMSPSAPIKPVAPLGPGPAPSRAPAAAPAPPTDNESAAADNRRRRRIERRRESSSRPSGGTDMYD